MKKIFPIIVICITFYACKPGIPNEFIKPDKMEKVLYDIHTVDGYIGTLQKPDTAKIAASSYYKGIYRKFDIDSASYTKSLNYYFEHPDLLNKMYENLIKQFEEERKRNDKRVNDEALTIQRMELAKNVKVLVVTYPSLGRPKFNFDTNPFILMPPLVQ